MDLLDLEGQLAMELKHYEHENQNETKQEFREQRDRKIAAIAACQETLWAITEHIQTAVLAIDAPVKIISLELEEAEQQGLADFLGARELDSDTRRAIFLSDISALLSVLEKVSGNFDDLNIVIRDLVAVHKYDTIFMDAVIDRQIRRRPPRKPKAPSFGTCTAQQSNSCRTSPDRRPPVWISSMECGTMPWKP